MRRIQPTLALALPAALAACTTFSSVRSAAPPPGLGVHVQAAMGTPPGDAAAWFWSFDCAERCDRLLGGTELMVTYGIRGADSTSAPLTLGVGFSGIDPAAEVYWRIGGAPGRPYGVGARASRFERRSTYQLFGRVDLHVGREERLLWNPGVMLHRERPGLGWNGGEFLGLVQGIGVEGGTGRWRARPSVSYVLGRASRVSYGRRSSPVTRGFVTISLGMGYELGRPER